MRITKLVPIRGRRYLWKYKLYDPTMTTEDKIQIDLIEINQRHDSGWAEWLCNIEFEDGRRLTGCSIESDGHLHARKTLRDDNGNPIPIISAVQKA